ncbi:MAG: hypothetical protein MJ095_00135 [Oscillospiraceae bacterium]|nr:hypothetical protein [Oscillospiraceae bacterium]
MSCSSVLYAANRSTQVIPEGVPTVVDFGQIVRRFGCQINMSGGNVSILSGGYYDMDANFTFTATAGEVRIQLFQNGAPIPGAYAAVTAAADTMYAVSIPDIVKNTCCSEETITAVVTSDSEVTISNAAIKIEKI